MYRTTCGEIENKYMGIDCQKKIIPSKVYKNEITVVWFLVILFFIYMSCASEYFIILVHVIRFPFFKLLLSCCHAMHARQAGSYLTHSVLPV